MQPAGRPESRHAFSVASRAYGFVEGSCFREFCALTSSSLVRKPRVTAGAPPPSWLVRDVSRDVHSGRCSQGLFSGVFSLRGS